MTTTTKPAPPADLTTGEMSLRAGVLAHHLRLLAERGEIPARRAGKYWSFAVADLDAIREAAKKAGYLRQTA